MRCLKHSFNDIISHWGWPKPFFSTVTLPLSLFTPPCCLCIGCLVLLLSPLPSLSSLLFIYLVFVSNSFLLSNSTHPSINLYFLKVENISSGYSNSKAVRILEINAPFAFVSSSHSPSLLRTSVIPSDQNGSHSLLTIEKWPQKPFQSLKIANLF